MAGRGVLMPMRAAEMDSGLTLNWTELDPERSSIVRPGKNQRARSRDSLQAPGRHGMKGQSPRRAFPCCLPIA